MIALTVTAFKPHLFDNISDSSLEALGACQDADTHLSSAELALMYHGRVAVACKVIRCHLTITAPSSRDGKSAL